jgi:hypothetical protein
MYVSSDWYEAVVLARVLDRALGDGTLLLSLGRWRQGVTDDATAPFLLSCLLAHPAPDEHCGLLANACTSRRHSGESPPLKHEK